MKKKKKSGRFSISIDAATLRELSKLAGRWSVAQSDLIRYAVQRVLEDPPDHPADLWGPPPQIKSPLNGEVMSEEDPQTLEEIRMRGEMAKRTAMRRMLEIALQRNGWRLSPTARDLQTNSTSLREVIKRDASLARRMNGGQAERDRGAKRELFEEDM